MRFQYSMWPMKPYFMNRMPNKSVKGTRRPLAVLEFRFYQGSAASLKLSERRAPYRNVRRFWVFWCFAYWLCPAYVNGFGKVSFVSGSYIVSHAFASCAAWLLCFTCF